jgi:hypothetical protein
MGGNDTAAARSLQPGLAAAVRATLASTPLLKQKYRRCHSEHSEKSAVESSNKEESSATDSERQIT